MHRLRLEFTLFFLALGFLSRLPVPSDRDFSEARLSASSRYFPLVGLFVGALISVFFTLALLVFEAPLLSLLLALAFGLLLTGAFHEDGFADFCDGFGGGWKKEQVLAIMQDSRLGTYGAVGIVSLLAIKLVALAQLPVQTIPFALLLGHSWSRLLAISLLMDMRYVRAEGKSKPLGTAISIKAFLFAIATVAPLAWWLGLLPSLLIIGLLLVFRWRFKAWLQRRIGGYTGDCLGACQQLAEVLIYLCLLVFWVA